MASEVPARCRAAIRQGTGSTSTSQILNTDVAKPKPGQSLFKINCPGLCGSDKSLLHDEWVDFGVAMMPLPLAMICIGDGASGIEPG